VIDWLIDWSRPCIQRDAHWRRRPGRPRSTTTLDIGVGTIFRLGSKNWTTLLLGKQDNQDNQTQSTTLCNIYFSEKLCVQCTQCAQCTMGSGAKLGICENFCVKGNLRVCKVTFNCKLQKKIGEQDILVASPIILLGELPLLPHFPRLWHWICFC